MSKNGSKILSKLTLILVVDALLFGTGILGCGTNHDEAAHAPASSPQASATTAEKRYPFQGKVVAINKENRHVTFNHEDIPGYMEAMDGMPFPVKEDRWLNDLSVGDQVRATLVVSGPSTYWLEEIDTTKKK